MHLPTKNNAVGSQLGPTLANIFLCHHETKWLKNCLKINETILL